jgi:predicted DNA-binding transcriptional regulator AlpA
MSDGRRHFGSPRQFSAGGTRDRGEPARAVQGNQTRPACVRETVGEAASRPFLPSAEAAKKFLEARAHATEHEKRGTIGLDSLQYLRASDVCRLLRISKPTLWRLRRSRGFPEPTEVTDRLIAWRRSEVEEWLGRVASARKLPPMTPTPRVPVTENVTARESVPTQANPPKARSSRNRSRPEPPEEQLALPLKIVS